MLSPRFRSVIVAGALAGAQAATAVTLAGDDPWAARRKGVRVEAPAAPSPGLMTRSGRATGDAAASLLPAAPPFVLPEIAVDTSMPAVPAHDAEGSAFARTNGEVCVLMLEDFRLRALFSQDAGQTFISEIDVTGGPGAGAVRGYSARLSEDDRVYAALIVSDPNGDLGLRFVRSDDMGRTWTAPIDLVKSGDPTHGVDKAVLETGPAGTAAVIYRGDRGGDPYVRSTSDSGATWSPPVRVDTGVAPRASPTAWEDLAFDAVGRLYVVYTQARHGAGPSVWTARSSNGGVTFGPEQGLDAVIPFHEAAARTDIHAAGDGQGILIAFWDSAGPTESDHMYVVRSGNQGMSYSLVFNQTAANTGISFPMTLATVPGVATALLLAADDLGRLTVFRSTNNGSSWGGGTLLSTASSGSPFLNRPFTRTPFVRTTGGTWALAWSDESGDTYARLRTDVHVVTSANEGLSWSPPQRADGGGVSESRVEGLAAPGSNALFVLFQDGRPEDGRTSSFYANRSAASPLVLGADYRIDADGPSVSPGTLNDPVVATDGVSHVYVAFSALSPGPFSSPYVAASADGGRSFSPPVRVGSSPAGSRIEWAPAVRATPDGYVYLAWISDSPFGQREVRFNRSADFGVTWMPSDLVLGSFSSLPAGYFYDIERPAITMAAVTGGRVYVAWSTLTNIFMGRSSDGGATMPVFDVDEDERSFNRYPRLCAQGDQVIMVWRSPDLALEFFSIWAIVSEDRGVNWANSRQLRPEGVGSGVDLVAIACDGTDRAVAFWSDLRSGRFQTYASPYDGTDWGRDVPVEGPLADTFFPEGVWASGDGVVVTFQDSAGGVWASRSMNGGASFPFTVRLDAAAPDPGAPSYQPLVSSDGAGNVWASWLDTGSGNPSVLVRHSADSGVTFGPISRADTAEPGGGRFHDYLPAQAQAAALPGAGFVTWSGDRESSRMNVLVNAHGGLDLDRDGTAGGTDCDDADPAVEAIPSAITGTSLSSIPGGARLSWDSQEAQAGTATVYDVVTGALADLSGTGRFDAAVCLAAELPDGPHDDVGLPPPGEGAWYLLRARNRCGAGTYGDSAITPDPRDQLDGASPCP